MLDKAKIKCYVFPLKKQTTAAGFNFIPISRDSSLFKYWKCELKLLQNSCYINFVDHILIIYEVPENCPSLVGLFLIWWRMWDALRPPRPAREWSWVFASTSSPKCKETVSLRILSLCPILVIVAYKIWWKLYWLSAMELTGHSWMMEILCVCMVGFSNQWPHVTVEFLKCGK